LGTIERLSGVIEKRYERSPKRLEGLSVVPLTYLGQLVYTRLYLGTLKSGWNFWWRLLEDVRNPKGKPWITYLPLTSPTQLSWRGGAVLAAACCAKRLD